MGLIDTGFQHRRDGMKIPIVLHTGEYAKCKYHVKGYSSKEMYSSLMDVFILPCRECKQAGGKIVVSGRKVVTITWRSGK